MVQTSIITSFVKRTLVLGGSVQLEQKPWDHSIGIVTMLDVIEALAGVILDDGSEAFVDCGMAGDNSRFEAIIYAYPSPSNLTYNVGMTNGVFAKAGRGVVSVTETKAFSLSTEASMGYPVHHFVSARWVGAVYTEDGSIATSPGWTVDGQKVTIDQAVYGTLELKYAAMRDVFKVTVTARQTAPENIFQSVLYAHWDGGVRLLNVSAPENAEDGYLTNIDCSGNGDGDGYSGGLIVISPDPDPSVPTPDPKNKEITLNYCEDFGNEE